MPWIFLSQYRFNLPLAFLIDYNNFADK